MIVCRDTEGLRLAALEMFDKARIGEGCERAIRHAAQAGNLQEVERIAEAEELSPGYAQWIEYLLWLEKMLDADVKFALTDDEASGLQVFKAARAEYKREHPACPGCGALQEHRFVRECAGCGKKFRE